MAKKPVKKPTPKGKPSAKSGSEYPLGKFGGGKVSNKGCK